MNPSDLVRQFYPPQFDVLHDLLGRFLHTVVVHCLFGQLHRLVPVLLVALRDVQDPEGQFREVVELLISRGCLLVWKVVPVDRRFVQGLAELGDVVQ